MENIQKWIDEFATVLPHHNPSPRVSPTITNKASPLRLGDSTNFLKLQPSSVLLDISNSLIQGRDVDEGTLDLLEILEKLLLRQRSVITESHKSAYCWAAAECTARFMWPPAASSEGCLFADAVERIWTKRVRVLKEGGSGLVSDELLKWEVDLKKAVEDPEMYQRIRETNTRYIAISFLIQLLQEQRSGGGEGEENRDVEAVGCLEDDGIDKVNEQHGAEEEEEEEEEEGTMGTQEQEHKPRLRRRLSSTVVPLKKARKPNKLWTPEEVEALREGVDKYGTSWRSIKDANPAVFAERTQVDLKGKWKNLVRLG